MVSETVKIEVFLPKEHIKPIVEAINRIGACRVGNYDHVASVGEVSGFWRPLEGSRPFSGALGEISEGTECRLEVRCPRELASAAVKEIKRLHPYEEPVINIIPLLNDSLGIL